MKAKTLITFLVVIFSLLENEAQVVGGIPGKGLDMQTYQGGFVTELPMAPPETKGDVYLESQWSVATIMLYKQTKLEGISIRLNLKTNSFEINDNNQIKALAAFNVKQFTWMNSTTLKKEDFINGKEFKFKGVLIEGFFKIIQVEGEWSLLSKTNLTLVKGNYVASLDAGERNNKFVKKDDFYLAKEFHLLRGNIAKKKFLAQFEKPHQDELRQFISKNELSTKRVEDLILIVNYLNSAE